MLRVGLTGGIGSGKSAVAAMLCACGARVSSSDEIGRRLMQPGQEVFHDIIQHFGKGVLTGSGSLDRHVLARLAFEQGRIDELNAIVHPAVIAEQQRWMSAMGAEDVNAVTVVESALIFETKWGERGTDVPWRTRFDRIVVVTAPEDVRQARYIERLRGSMSADDAATDFARRAAVQWSDEKKSALADFVLRNETTLEELRSAVERLFVTLQQEAMDRAVEAM